MLSLTHIGLSPDPFAPLDSLRLAEIDWILAVQQLPAWFEPIMEFLSMLGREEFFLLLLPFVYWCISPRLGVKVGLILIVTGGMNAVAKLVTHAPRPYWIDSRVQILSTETTFGMPSGHAQVAATVWGVLAAPSRRPIVWWSAGVLAILISFSRIYLGVHFISDVVVGLLLGVLVLWLFLRWENAVVAWWQSRSLRVQIGLSLAASAVLLGSALAASAVYTGWTMPEAWKHATQTDTESLRALIAMSGSLFGLLAGASLMRHLGWFSVAGSIPKRALRWFVGSTVMAAIYLAVHELIPDTDTVATSILRYAGYALLTLWTQLGAPLLFRRLNLIPPR